MIWSIKIVQLKHQLHKKYYLDHFLMILLSICFFLFIHNWFSIILLIFNLLILLTLINKIKLILIGIIIGLIGYIILQYLYLQNNYHQYQIKGYFKIKKKDFLGHYIIYKNTNIIVKWQNDLMIGDKIYLEGIIEKINDSNLEWYLKSQNTYLNIIPKKLEIIEVSNNLKTKLLDFVNKQNPIYKNFVKLFYLGIKEKNLYDDLKNLGISHLFIVSGFHISLMITFLNKVFKKVFNEKTSFFIIFTLVFTYIYFFNFNLSSIRAFLMSLLFYSNKLFLKKKWNSFDLLSLTMGLIFLSKPHSIYGINFILSFHAIFIILIVKKWKFFIKKWTFTTSLCFIINIFLLPWMIIINQKIVVFGAFNTLIMSPIYLLIFLSGILLLPFPDLYQQAYSWFLIMIDFLKKINLIIKINGLNFWHLSLFLKIILIKIIINKWWYIFTVKKNI